MKEPEWHELMEVEDPRSESPWTPDEDKFLRNRALVGLVCLGLILAEPLDIEASETLTYVLFFTAVLLPVIFVAFLFVEAVAMQMVKAPACRNIDLIILVCVAAAYIIKLITLL